MEEYRAEQIEGTRTKYYVVRVADGKHVAILEDRDSHPTTRGWNAWTWDEDECQVLRNAYAGGTLDYVLRRADEWL